MNCDNSEWISLHIRTRVGNKDTNMRVLGILFGGYTTDCVAEKLIDMLLSMETGMVGGWKRGHNGTVAEKLFILAQEYYKQNEKDNEISTYQISLSKAKFDMLVSISERINSTPGEIAGVLIDLTAYLMKPLLETNENSTFYKAL
ncbi:MAG: hypothetical protein H6Q66_1402 [Firmicutes bacterium]|nr:hypothetical protein [Bacillota bacterium]